MIQHILLDAQAEIKRLRHENEILHAKVSTMELFATALHTNPYHPSQCMSVDVVWEIQREIDKINDDEQPPSQPGPNDPGPV